jgi:ASC-1-like (ASCH) protein
VIWLPLLYARKEVLNWVKQGHKTIDVRKGKPRRGEIARFQSGPHFVKMRIVGREFGKILDVVRADNYRLVIPSASCLEDAVAYLRGIYGDCEGVFTAYHIAPLLSTDER